MLENAHKVTYIVQQYPQHTVPQIIQLLAMPAIEINTAFWYATNAGWLSEPDPETQRFTFLKAPEKWAFGEAVDTLRDHLLYAFTELAKKENDLDENTLSGWCMGYPSHDQLIALSLMLNDKVLATYDLTDPKDLKSTYTFYTLYENGEQMWGRKNFKEQPTGEEVPEDPDAPEPDANNKGGESESNDEK